MEWMERIENAPTLWALMGMRPGMGPEELRERLGRYEARSLGNHRLIEAQPWEREDKASAHAMERRIMEACEAAAWLLIGSKGGEL